MGIIVKYEGDEFLPKEIDNSIKTMERRIRDDRWEIDKIGCHIENLRGDIIRFLATHGEMIKDK